MLIISACLVGVNCKYNGGNNKNKKIYEIFKEAKAVSVCPEVLGGMDIPRIPCEIKSFSNKRRVINKEGKDQTQKFKRGAEKTLKIAKSIGAKKAIMKSRSPSCGFGKIYDGNFSNTLIKGNGITAELLNKNGIEIITENDLKK